MTYFPSHTCKHCKGHIRSDDGVHYAVRHWMHFDCYLDAGKSLDDLTDFQVGQFPWKLLKARGLLPKIGVRS